VFVLDGPVTLQIYLHLCVCAVTVYLIICLPSDLYGDYHIVGANLIHVCDL
jgi:hypothetical protein